MCGIAGFVADSLPRDAVDAVRKMNRAQARRGPDAEDLHVWEGAAVFGHRRLAIYDLSDAGRQPMLSPDGQTGVVFNGSIYNFHEIRRELEQRGCRFHSQCDTEVLVHGYSEWGIDGLVKRLRGMFAFAIWDHKIRKLTMVRDRLGVKPLLYSAGSHGLSFASTAGALAAAELAGGIDPAAVLEFLEFGWVTEDRCIFQNVRKVAPATIVEWQNGKISERRYWSLPEGGSRRIGFEDAVAETEELLMDAVKIRLEADVPVGALLSGGVDSTLICWAMSKLGANIRSFTVGAPGDPSDEARHAQETAQLLGIPHEVIQLPSGEQPAIDDLINAYGEPFACPSAIAMLQVSKAVKEKATVLLTGDGGDDVYLGYTYHAKFLQAQLVAKRLPAALANLWPALRQVVRRVPPLRRPMHFMDFATSGLGAATRTHDGLPYYENAHMLGARLAGKTLEQRAIPGSLRSARRLLQEFVDYERQTRFVSEYMTKVDGGTMYYAIEARSPFLDQKIWESAAAMPFDIHLRGWELKAVLRELVRRKVGPAVASRRKQGFTVPVERWLATGWRPQIESLAEGAPRLESEGWIAPGTLKNAADKALAQGRAPLQMWTLIVLEQWLRHNSSRTPAPLPVSV
ncbi:MAG TPA: asparagine synthase (glutamine-hydrolyzing) [Bryobacteraceae bacterium]|nr:asparagine synthase (glutamine-hydrolyzing) [Bryobacteraceae bacterium]